MKQTVKKLALVASIAATLGGGVSVASAAVQYPEGGVWTYGSGNSGAYSNYYHPSKYHSSTVVSRKTGSSDKGYAGAGGTSRAWIRTSWGEKVAFYYNV
ncbi:lactococcin 972 family bacteriocin [Streptococcus pneumoniae]|uniref:lactococcin 972 family bacteriocin n=1 Tax=Streptococcus pneumoniae TaxID=1313 RepID=UPI0007653934|nr:lactococcin 972 family bacteriocin [Streptococcus pneumoniae]CVO03297.1 bacteriocin%2C lactococcin 972 family [Streptococcus pneumoniae]CWK24107.1 bacteriocin%2C lactococcin 972 family [Streptococcus pneumoniae]